MFNFFNKHQNEQKTTQQKDNSQFAQYASDPKYIKMINECSVEDLKSLVDYEKEPYVLSLNELQYMLTICNDVQKQGVIYFAIATCYYSGTRGATMSRKQGMQYDNKAKDARNSYAALRYGTNLIADVGRAIKAGTINDNEASFKYGLGVGYIIQSYRQGCKDAKDILEMLMEDREEFYGAHSVEELIRIWPDSFK